MCSLVQKSTNINWLERRSYWHELTGSREVRVYLSNDALRPYLEYNCIELRICRTNLLADMELA